MPLFDQPKAEAVLKSLLDTTKQHEKELSVLRKLYNFAPSPLDDSNSEGGLLLGKLRSLETRLDQLASRMDDMERAVQIPGGNTTCTVGEGLAANRKTLARALNMITTKAETDEVTKQISSHKSQVDETIVALTEKVAGVTALEKTNDAVSALSERMDTLAEALNTKANHSTIKVLEADASLIRHHAAFVSKTNDALEKTEGDFEQFQGSMAKQGEMMESLKSNVSSIQEDVARRAVADDLSSLLQKVDRMSTEVNETTKKTDFDSLKALFDEKTQSLAKAEGDIQSLLSSHSTMSSQVSNQMAEHRAAVGRLVSGCVSREALSNSLSTLQAEWQQKTWTLERSLSELSVDYATTKKKSDLAAEFVSWYGSRGDTYEHNLQAVDEHLKKLAR